MPRLDEELKRSKRTEERFAVLFLDLDKLKEINDVHGHLMGDTVIREVAQLIKATTREYDLGVKYGGDEFVVVLQRIDADGALRVAEALRSGVEQLGPRLGIMSWGRLLVSRSRSVPLGFYESPIPCGKDTWTCEGFEDRLI